MPKTTEAYIIARVFNSFIRRIMRPLVIPLAALFFCFYLFQIASAFHEYTQRKEPSLDQFVNLSNSPSMNAAMSAYTRVEELSRQDPSILSVVHLESGKAISTSFPLLNPWRIKPIDGVEYTTKIYGNLEGHQLKVIVARGHGLLLEMIKQKVIFTSGIIAIVFLKLAIIVLAFYLVTCFLIIKRIDGERLVDARPGLSYSFAAISLALLTILLVPIGVALSWLLIQRVDHTYLARNEFSSNGVFYICDLEATKIQNDNVNCVINRERVSDKYLVAVNQLLGYDVKERMISKKAEFASIDELEAFSN